MTCGEKSLVHSVFGDTVDTGMVLLKRRRWFPFQPRAVLMAPCGHIHFHPRSPSWCDEFSQAPLPLQGLFVHEMTHVWQTQTRGKMYLPLHRPFSRRYDYCLKPGWKLQQYGIEQQAEIVRHAFLTAHGIQLAGAPSLSAYRAILPAAFAL